MCDCVLTRFGLYDLALSLSSTTIYSSIDKYFRNIWYYNDPLTKRPALRQSEEQVFLLSERQK